MIKKWVQNLFEKPDLIILDTETTGLDNDAEVVQIGILSPAGDILLDTLVRPTCSIPPRATLVHGISDDHVREAPTITELESRLRELIHGKTVVVYNADYDWRILWQSFAARNDWNDLDMTTGRWLLDNLFVDVMVPYTEHWGEWSEWHQSYTWQKLANACRQQEIIIEDAYSAVGDCKMTLALLRRLAGVE